jgi:hypothetical protein
MASFENSEGPSGVPLALHVVGRLTLAVLSVFRPLAETIAQTDGQQIVIAIDGETAMLSSLPSDLQKVAVADHPSAVVRARRLRQQLQAVMATTPVRALHLHGVIPALACAGMAKALRKAGISVFFHPHSSRALLAPAPVRAAALGMLSLLLEPAKSAWIANLPAERRTLNRIATPEGALVAGGCAADVFFDIGHEESLEPVIVGSGDAEGSDALQGFLQLAVLLGDDELGIHFEWMGPVHHELLPALKAAGVTLHTRADEAARARILRRAWVYIAAHEERGFPVDIVEAMAVGVPCVVCDGENHRELLSDGKSGYICSGSLELVQRVAQLIDDASLRASIGAGGRRDAQARFSLRITKSRLSTLLQHGSLQRPSVDPIGVVSPGSGASSVTPCP